MMQRLFITLILFLSFGLGHGLGWAATPWQNLAPGLDYARVQNATTSSTGVVHGFRIDLHQYQLQNVLTHNDQGGYLRVKDVVQQQGGLLGINGGFFGPNLKPLGLRIQQGEKISPLRRISWWGVFYIKNKRAYIRSQKRFKWQKNMALALQSGPRLVINGKIPTLKKGLASRSAIGITYAGEVIIAATQHLAISTTDLAEILRRSTAEGGFNCQYALNLDGGSSTQLFAQLGSFTLSVSSYAPIADVLLVKPN